MTKEIENNAKAKFSSLENLNKKNDNIKVNIGYKPTNIQKGGFAAQMLKNRNKYFNKNSKNNQSMNNEDRRNLDSPLKHESLLTSEVIPNSKINKHIFATNEHESTSINDSESESLSNKISNQLSHHAKIKDKLRLLKGNMKNQ